MRGLNLVGPSQSHHQAVQARGEAVDIEIQRIVVAVGDLCVDRGMERGKQAIVIGQLELRSGRVDHWRKIKNPAAPAMKREAEEFRGDTAAREPRRFPPALIGRRKVCVSLISDFARGAFSANPLSGREPAILPLHVVRIRPSPSSRPPQDK
jgi:hypothetical protein